MGGDISSPPCRHPVAGGQGAEGTGGSGHGAGGARAVGQEEQSPSQCHQCREQWEPGGSPGRRKGPRSHTQPRAAVLYLLHAGPGLGLSRVTQALQPARIRGDGTFLSKNNPPAAGERAGVEVTDWTAAHAAPLPGPHSPRRGPGPGGHRASPMPRWLQAELPRGGPQGPVPQCTAQPGDLSLKSRWHQLCQAQVGRGSPHRHRAHPTVGPGWAQRGDGAELRGETEAAPERATGRS